MLFGKALSSWALLNVCFIHNSLAATGGQSMNGHLAVPPHPPLENTDTVVLPYETPQESTEEITETTTPPRKKRKSVGWEDKQPVEHSNAPPESITHVTLPSDGPPHPGTPNVVTIQISEMDKKDGENESDHPPLVKRTSVPGDRHGREKEQKKENMEKEKQNLEKEKQNLAKEKEMFEKEMEKEKQTLEMEKQNLEKEKEILEKEKQAQILEKKKEKQNLGKELEPDSEMGVEEERADGVWNPFSGTHQPGPAPEKVVRHERVEGYHWVERYACDPFGAPAPSELPAVAEANTWTIGEVVTPYITEENSSVETAMLLETCLDSTTKRTILEEDAKSTKWKDAFQEAERHLREVGKRSVQFGINGLNGGVHYFTVTAYDKSEKLPEDLVVITDSWQNVYGMQNRRMLRKDFLQASKTIFSGEASIPDAQAAMRLLFPQYPKKAIDADHIPKLYQTITGLVNGKRLVKRRISYDVIPCMHPKLAFPYPSDPPTHSFESLDPPTPYVPSKPEINRDRVVLRSAPRGPAVELPPPRRPAPADPIPERCEGDTRESPQLGPSNVKKLDQQLPPSNVPAMAVSNLTWLLLVAAVLMGPGNVLG